MGSLTIKNSKMGWMINALKKSSRLDKEYSKFGETLLHIAARDDSEEVCSYLLNTAYNVDCVDDFGQTPLFNAISVGAIGSCIVLLEAGANPNHKDNFGNSPLHRAVTARLDASFKINIELINILLRSGASINQVNNFNETPLCACYPSKIDLMEDSGCFKFGRTKVAKFLIDNGGLLENE